MNPLRHLAAGLAAALILGILTAGVPALRPGDGLALAGMGATVAALIVVLYRMEQRGGR